MFLAPRQLGGASVTNVVLTRDSSVTFVPTMPCRRAPVASLFEIGALDPTKKPDLEGGPEVTCPKCLTRGCKNKNQNIENESTGVCALRDGSKNWFVVQ